MEIQDIYQKAIDFAGLKHAEKEQTIPGTKIPYVVHLSQVAMEVWVAYQHKNNFNIALALPVALLHDTIEDTSTTYIELVDEFGSEVAEGVLALTKNPDLPKNEQMIDSLSRIKKLSKEIWAVKLADRITNLQKPPSYWNKDKKITYQNEANLILETLKGANSFLERRLLQKIRDYQVYID